MLKRSVLRVWPLTGTFLSLCLSATASAQDTQSSQTWPEWLAHDPIQWQFNNDEIRLGGSAAGALFTSAQSGGPGFPGGYENSSGSAVVTGNVRVQRTFDNGLVLGARSEVLIYRDRLSGDNYNNDTIQRIYVFTQTGFGRFEIGQVDGAAYTLGLAGPIVDSNVTLEGHNIA